MISTDVLKKGLFAITWYVKKNSQYSMSDSLQWLGENYLQLKFKNGRGRSIEILKKSQEQILRQKASLLIFVISCY